jgi:ArsR family transcriptional regulator
MLTDSQARAGSEPARSGDTRDAQIAVEDIARLCKASGDRLRLEILQLLRRDSVAVQELCALLDMRQPALSHHLKVMGAAGLITSRREGNTIFYRRAIPDLGNPLGHAQQSLLDAMDSVETRGDLAHGLQLLRSEREQSSREFFRQNADKFRAQQDLIASYEQYAGTVVETLASAPLSSHRKVLEVGPGDGAFLCELSPRFERVIALDNAETMLDKSRQRATAEGFENIEFIHGDTGHQRLADLAADCIVVNMVLHHTPAPAEIFSDLTAALGEEGVLLVTDLCRHDQDWARDACGDLWLGFEPEELARWAQAAGLREIAGAYLAQRNGFQVQVRLFGHRTVQQG